MDGPPEMVDGMVMKVMTSCSLRRPREKDPAAGRTPPGAGSKKRFEIKAWLRGGG